MAQMSLKLAVVKAGVVDGIEMGVLENGDAYLNSRGLASVCGVAVSGLLDHVSNWESGNRTGKVARFLESIGFDAPSLYTETSTGEHAHPEAVCIAFLEYYAYVSKDVAVEAREKAQRNHRLLARYGFSRFIYRALGYVDSDGIVPDAWRKFHDRMLLVTSPVGYFSVFKETADFVLAAIREGLIVDEKTVPDGSVGKAWAPYWVSENLAARFGERVKFEHNFPSSYPQSASNPQDIWVYPVDALGEFRRWMHRTYIPEKFPAYLKTKIAKGALTVSAAELILSAVSMPEEKLLPAAGKP